MCRHGQFFTLDLTLRTLFSSTDAAVDSSQRRPVRAAQAEAKVT
jgi:hypothetical protein